MQSEEAFVQVVTTHPTSVGQGGSMRGNVAPSGAVPSSGTVSSSSRLQTMYPGDTVFGRLSKHFRQEGKIVTISGTVKAPEYHIQWSDGTSSDCKRRGFWSAIEMQMASEASEPQPYDVPTKESVMLQRQQEQRQFEDMALKANNERLQQFVLKNSNHSIHNLPTPGFQTLSQGPLHQAQYVPHPQHEQQELDLFQAMFQNTSNSHPVGRQQIPSQEHGQEQSDDQHRAKIPRLGELSSRNEFDQQLPTYPSSTNGISSIQNILLGLAPEESLINRATAGTSTTVIPSLHPLTVDNHGLTTEDITAMNNGMSNGFNEGQYQSHPLFPQLQASQPQIARSTSNNSLFFQQQNSVEPSKPESLQHPHSVSEPTPSTQQSTFEPVIYTCLSIYLDFTLKSLSTLDSSIPHSIAHQQTP